MLALACWSIVDQHVGPIRKEFKFNMLINCWSTCWFNFQQCWSTIDQHVEWIQLVDELLTNMLISCSINSYSKSWSIVDQQVDLFLLSIQPEKLINILRPTLDYYVFLARQTQQIWKVVRKIAPRWGFRQRPSSNVHARYKHICALKSTKLINC